MEYIIFILSWMLRVRNTQSSFLSQRVMVKTFLPRWHHVVLEKPAASIFKAEGSQWKNSGSWYPFFTKLHSIISQKDKILIFTAVKILRFTIWAEITSGICDVYTVKHQMDQSLMLPICFNYGIVFLNTRALLRIHRLQELILMI